MKREKCDFKEVVGLSYFNDTVQTNNAIFFHITEAGPVVLVTLYAI